MELDRHRNQITAEVLDTATGQVAWRRIQPADGECFRRVLRGFDGKHGRNRDRAPRATFEEGYRCAKVCETILRSATSEHRELR